MTGPVDDKAAANDRQIIIQLIHGLERDPLGADAGQARERLKTWIENVPDFKVPVVPDLLKPLELSRVNHADVIFTQMILSSAAFALENPQNAGDLRAVCMAGLLGSLRTYEAILQQRPGERWPFLDDLLERRNNDTLDHFTAKILATVDRNRARPWKEVFSFSGRISRSTFWLYQVSVIASSFVLAFFLGLLLFFVPGVPAEPTSGGVGAGISIVILLTFLCVLALVIPMIWVNLAAMVKRWHDLGHSGWMVLFVLIPIIGGLIQLVYLGFVKGTAGPNSYGGDPLQQEAFVNPA